MIAKLVLFVRFIIAISFIVIGVLNLVYRNYFQLPDIQAYGFSILLFVYGLFRIYRAYRSSDDIFIEK